MGAYEESDVHLKKPGRKVRPKDAVEDYVEKGGLRLAEVIERWTKKRSNERSTEENYENII